MAFLENMNFNWLEWQSVKISNLKTYENWILWQSTNLNLICHCGLTIWFKILHQITVMRQFFWPKVPLCTSLVSHNFVWGTLYCSCMHFYASSSHSIMSLSIKMQGNIKTSGIHLPMGSTEKGIVYYSIIWPILCSINLKAIL